MSNDAKITYNNLQNKLKSFISSQQAHAEALLSKNQPMTTHSLIEDMAQMRPRFSFFDNDSNPSPDNSTVVTGEKEIDEQTEIQLKDAIDGIIATQCSLCNTIMIDSLDEPFVNIQDVASNDTWKVPTI